MNTRTDNEFTQRMAYVARLAGNATLLAKRTGISRRAIGTYLSGDSDPTRERLVNIAGVAGVSVEWLATGNGPVFSSDGEDISPLVSAIVKTLKPLIGKITARKSKELLLNGFGERRINKILDGDIVPSFRELKTLAGLLGQDMDLLVNVTGSTIFAEKQNDDYIRFTAEWVSAGGASCCDHAKAKKVCDAISFKKEWISDALGADPEQVCLFEVEGESMVPTLRPGDSVLVGCHDSSVEPHDGVYVVKIGGKPLLKRVQLLPEGKLRVSSDNVMFEAFVVDLAPGGEQLELVGRVLWAGRRF